MANRILLKRNTTSGRDPSVNDLSVGELALNTADQKIFFKHSNNSLHYIKSIYSSSIDELSDVDTTTVLPTANQTLSWSTSQSKWVPRSVSDPISLIQLNRAGETVQTFTDVKSFKFDDEFSLTDLGNGTTKISLTSIQIDANGDVVLSADLDVTGELRVNGISVGYGYTGSQGNPGESSFAWGPTAPVQPTVGDRWFDTVNGAMTVFVADGDSQQWVEVAASGFIGVKGYTGSRGVIGFTGSRGTGFTGSSGFTGSRGGQGEIGYTGSQGIPGEAAFQGFTGSQGDIGFTGSVGFTGSQGVPGEFAALGYTGSQGEIGYTGSQGFTGSQGEIGYTGSQGIPGEFAALGYTGSQGFTGSVGFTGSQGIPGEAAAVGFTGSQGEIGYTGSRGEDGIIGRDGYTGSQGATGFTGSQGIPGNYILSLTPGTGVSINNNVAEGPITSTVSIGQSVSSTDSVTFRSLIISPDFDGFIRFKDYTEQTTRAAKVYTNADALTGVQWLSQGPDDGSYSILDQVTAEEDLPLPYQGTVGDVFLVTSTNEIYIWSGITLDDLKPGDYYYDDTTESIYIMIDTGLGYNQLLDLTVRA